LDGIAKEYGVLDKIEYTGFVENMQKLYAESSIFVLSSRYEAFGLVLIEAMSQGCACVACDYKGRQREIMCPEGQGSMFNVQSSNNKVELCETGILCEPDNVEALAEAMKKMIVDDEYRESVRAKAIGRSKYYSIENTMDRWEKLLTSVQ
jgi:glycosyltransferase involved in cell wall biosynthesis